MGKRARRRVRSYEEHLVLSFRYWKDHVQTVVPEYSRDDNNIEDKQSDILLFKLDSILEYR